MLLNEQSGDRRVRMSALLPMHRKRPDMQHPPFKNSRNRTRILIQSDPIVSQFFAPVPQLVAQLSQTYSFQSGKQVELVEKFEKQIRSDGNLIGALQTKVRLLETKIARYESNASLSAGINPTRNRHGSVDVACSPHSLRSLQHSQNIEPRLSSGSQTPDPTYNRHQNEQLRRTSSSMNNSLLRRPSTSMNSRNAQRYDPYKSRQEVIRPSSRSLQHPKRPDSAYLNALNTRVPLQQLHQLHPNPRNLMLQRQESRYLTPNGSNDAYMQSQIRDNGNDYQNPFSITTRHSKSRLP